MGVKSFFASVARPLQIIEPFSTLFRPVLWKSLCQKFVKMTRGNQRDLAREKAAKKAGKGKQEDTAGNAGLTVEQRKERDAKIMREKQEKKAAAAAEKATAGK